VNKSVGRRPYLGLLTRVFQCSLRNSSASASASSVLAATKLGILAASLIAGVGWTILRG
jgi:hypothetical protein